MPNPKGNPNIADYGFKTDREESCTARLSMRIPPSLKEKLKERKGWQEDVRQYMEKLVEAKSA